MNVGWLQLACADVAQLVEQLIRNEQVVGSNPIISSIMKMELPVFPEAFCVLCSRLNSVRSTAGLVQRKGHAGKSFAEQFLCLTAKDSSCMRLLFRICRVKRV